MAGSNLRALIPESYDGSYFVTRYSTQTHICATRAGSRPGESLADITYGFIFHEALADIHKSLKKAKVLVEVPFDGDLHPVAQEFCCCSELLGPTWADDSTFMCADKDPQCLMHKTEVLCKTVIDECTARGLVPNMKPGKTSILLNLRGTGSHKARMEVFGQGDQLYTSWLCC